MDVDKLCNCDVMSSEYLQSFSVSQINKKDCYNQTMLILVIEFSKIYFFLLSNVSCVLCPQVRDDK